MDVFFGDLIDVHMLRRIHGGEKGGGAERERERERIRAKLIVDLVTIGEHPV